MDSSYNETLRAYIKLDKMYLILIVFVCVCALKKVLTDLEIK